MSFSYRSPLARVLRYSVIGLHYKREQRKLNLVYPVQFRSLESSRKLVASTRSWSVLLPFVLFFILFFFVLFSLALEGALMSHQWKSEEGKCEGTWHTRTRRQVDRSNYCILYRLTGCLLQWEGARVNTPRNVEISLNVFFTLRKRLFSRPIQFGCLDYRYYVDIIFPKYYLIINY